MNPAESFAQEVLALAKTRTAEGSLGETEDEILQMAERHGYGNVRQVFYDPAAHGTLDCSPGDRIWFWGNLTTAEAWAADAANWVCTGCGAPCVPDNGNWRWNGSAWEHHHGFPVGHVLAKRRKAE